MRHLKFVLMSDEWLGREQVGTSLWRKSFYSSILPTFVLQPSIYRSGMSSNLSTRLMTNSVLWLSCIPDVAKMLSVPFDQWGWPKDGFIADSYRPWYPPWREALISVAAMRTWCIKTSSLGLEAERPGRSIPCVAVCLLNRQALCQPSLPPIKTAILSSSSSKITTTE